MWKPIGVITTVCLVIVSLIALALAAWCYDKDNFADLYSNDYLKDFRPYIDALRAILAVDLLMFIVSFVGIFFLVKPSAGASKCYVFFIVVVVVFKIVAGAIWYNGVNDTGKAFNTAMQTTWDNWSSAYGDKPDSLLAWHTQRGAELASIVIFGVFGLLSGIAVLKVSG